MTEGWQGMTGAGQNTAEVVIPDVINRESKSGKNWELAGHD